MRTTEHSMISASTVAASASAPAEYSFRVNASDKMAFVLFCHASAELRPGQGRRGRAKRPLGGAVSLRPIIRDDPDQTE